jgi:hypoxia up-regulated 1
MDNVKGLFGFGSKKDDDQQVLEDDAGDATEASASATLTPLPASDPTSSGSTISSASPTPAESSSSASAAKSANAGKATPSLVSIPLALRSTVVGLNVPPLQSLPRIQQRLTQFDTSDRNTALRAEALNTFEAFTYRAREYLGDDTFIAASSASERQALETQLASTSEWLDEEGADATVQDFKEKLQSLQRLVDPVLKRRDEASKRPDAIKALKDGLENLGGMIKMVEGNIQKAAEEASAKASSAASTATSGVAASSSLSTAEGDDLDEDPYSSSAAADAAVETDEPPVAKPYEYTPEDLSALTKKYDAVKVWLEEKLALQDKLGSSDDPVLLVSDLENKGQDVQKAVSDTILKTIKMQDIPRKPKAGKKAKSKSKKSKPASKSAPKTEKSSSTESGASSATVSSSKSVKDEL